MTFRRSILFFGFVCILFIPLIFITTDLQAISFFKDASYYNEGLKAFGSKNYQKSIHFMKKALKENPDYFEAKQLLGWNYIFTNRLAESETVFLALLTERTDDIRPVQGLAWTYYGQGRLEEAQSAFKNERSKAEKHTKNDNWERYPRNLEIFFNSIISDANYGLGLVARQRKDYATAVDCIKTALKITNQFTEKVEIWIALGDIYFEQGQMADAISTYEKATQEDNKNQQALVKLAWTYYYSERYTEAEKSFEKAIILKGDFVEGVYGLALSQYRQSRFERAYANFIKAIALNPYYMDNTIVHEIIAGKPEWRTLWKEFGLAYKGRYAYNYRLGNYAAAIYKLNGYLEKVNPDDFDATLAAGWCYRWLGDQESAIKFFQAAAKLNNTSAEPYVGFGSVYMAFEKMEEAQIEYQRALKMAPNSPTANNGLAYFYYYKKDPGKTETCLRKAVSAKTDYFDSQAFLAGLLLEQKRYDEASKEYDKLVNLDKSMITSWNGLGWANYFKGDYEKAETAFEEAILLNPHLVEAYYGLGLSYAHKGEFDEAKEVMITAIGIAPGYCHTQDLLDLVMAKSDWHDLYKNLGWSYLFQQQYTQAIGVFTTYLDLERNDFDASRGLAWSNYWSGQLDAAYGIFKELLEKNKNDTDALIGTGWILYFRGMDEEALEHLYAAVKIDEKLTNAWRGIAAIYFRGKKFDKAEEAYQKISRLEPHALDVHNSQGWSLYYKNDYEGAIQKFTVSLRINRNLGEPYYGLALSSLRMGDIARAKEFFITAMRLYPAYMDGKELYGILDQHSTLHSLYTVMGWSYYDKYNYPAAKFHFERMLKIDPSDRDALLGIGAMAYVTGAYQEAVEYYDRLLPILPDKSKLWDKYSYMLENLGWSQYYLKKYDASFKTFKRLESYHPEISYIAPINGQAWCEFMRGNSTEAKRLFQLSLEILPGNYGAQKGMKTLMK